jgi:predicted ArsR family transcriptional regulator
VTHGVLSEAKANLVYLMKRRGSVTVGEASEELNLSPSTIRQHLSRLEADGFIDRRIHREGVGRPSTMYFLTRKAELFFQNRESDLLVGLVRTLVERGEQELLKDFFFRAWRERIALWKQMLAFAKAGEEVVVLNELLREWGFVPECRYNHEGQLVIEFFHCPYPNVAEVVPFQCQAELYLLQEVTGKTFCRTCELQKGDVSCRFLAISSGEGKNDDEVTDQPDESAPGKLV